VGGHYSGGRRAGDAHAIDVHLPATAAYAIAAAAAVPPLPLQPPPPTTAASAQALGLTGLTALTLRSCPNLLPGSRVTIELTLTLRS
jgi:hypothetical protein